MMEDNMIGKVVMIVTNSGYLDERRIRNVENNEPIDEPTVVLEDTIDYPFGVSITRRYADEVCDIDDYQGMINLLKQKRTQVNEAIDFSLQWCYRKKFEQEKSE